MDIIRFLVCGILLLLFQCVNAQTVILTPNRLIKPPIPDGTCATITVGKNITFERSISCGPNVLISDGGSTEFLNTAEQIFSYSFESTGRFIVFCGATPTGGAVATFAACYDVEMINTVPTLSEWGLGILGLLMLIFAIVRLSQKSGLSHNS